MHTKSIVLPSTIEDFENAIAESLPFSGDPEDFLAIIRHYRELDFPSQALEAAESAIRQFPEHLQFFLIQAQLLIEMRREAQAIELLNVADVAECGDLAIELMRAEALTCMGQYDAAMDLIDNLKVQSPKLQLADVLVAEAWVYEHRQEYEHTFLVLKSALEHQPGHQRALERLGTCVENTRRYEESIQLHGALIDAAPYASQAWYNLANAFAGTGRYEEALEAYEYAFLTNEDFEQAYMDYAELCIELGKPEQALHCYREAAARFAPGIELYTQLGRCHEALGNYQDAASNYQAALGFEPFDDELLYHIGCCQMALGRHDQAARYFRRALLMDDAGEEYHLALAEALAAGLKYNKAEHHFLEALYLSQYEERYLLAYARFLLHRHRAPEALELLEAECRETEDSPRLTYARIACLKAADRPAEAAYRLLEAIECFPDEASFLSDWAL